MNAFEHTLRHDSAAKPKGYPLHRLPCQGLGRRPRKDSQTICGKPHETFLVDERLYRWLYAARSLTSWLWFVTRAHNAHIECGRFLAASGCPAGLAARIEPNAFFEICAHDGLSAGCSRWGPPSATVNRWRDCRP